MELTEPIDSINRQLVDLFGLDTISGDSIWRVVWSEDQFEKRFGTFDDFTREGFYIRTVTEVREVPKYRQWIREKYVLERLTLVPEINKEELVGAQVSYEPIYVFENFRGEPLPPRVDVCKVIIDAIYAAQGKTNLAKYKEDFEQYTPEMQEKKINEIMEYLWDSSDISEALHQREGIVVPGNNNGGRSE